MSVWKGGRGVKAPYESTHVRVPLPVKDRVEKIADRYRETLALEIEIPCLDDAIVEARKILDQDRSAKASLEQLLTILYGETVNLL